MIEIILNAIKLAGAELPAFKTLFDGIVGTLHEKDQDKLKAAYAEAMKKSDDIHKQIQDL